METQREIIKEACNRKNITIRKMCDDLNINYEGFRSAVRRARLRSQTAMKISKYLDIDIFELISAPISTTIKKGNNNG